MAAALYVYYRVQDNILPIRQHIASLMAEIEKITGIKGRLLQRRDDAQTWMEVYEPVADADALQQALQDALATRPLLAALARHEECFVPLA
ncbi:uncharacterized protein DUF4936 [Vogesella indigofera]|uniref:Uncharacterized protein DUF4936 n=1 Tax=Vogesella indigofera TaxID=45465 RepID=A0A495B2B1_VOGIN|nr:DUF4936 family protein [Vogesella indigofera]RKQ54753.1 uncharacterized protein DUF4936 [Vogesella indigofera]